MSCETNNNGGDITHAIEPNTNDATAAIPVGANTKAFAEQLPDNDEQCPAKDANATLQQQHVVADTSLADGAIFENARNYVKPGSFFQFLTSLYSERKFVVVILVHFVTTMIIWGTIDIFSAQTQP